MEVRFNRSEVEALKQDRRELAEAYSIGIEGGWVQVAEGRAALGLPIAETDRIYLRSMQVIPEPAGKAYHSTGKKTDVEERIIASSEQGRANRAQRDLMAAMVRDEIDLESEFEPEIEAVLQKFGAAVADVALDVLEELEPKATPSDELAVDRILALLDEEPYKDMLKDAGGVHYLRVAQRTYKTITLSIGLAVDLPNHREVEIIKEGGRRLGLLKLKSPQTRAGLLNIIATAREAHEGPVVIARKIRDTVGGGRWRNPKVRAKVVARTETAHAQRKSQLEAYRDSGTVETVMVFDARIGATDTECEALDGRLVSIEEAWALMNEEHPNGSRSFSPVIT